MGNMYDTLGDFLNKTLEDGKIPEPKPEFTSSGNYSFSKNASNKTKEKINKATVSLEGLPQTIKNAFIVLHSLPDQSLEAIKKNYRKLLKAAHPDTSDSRDEKSSSVTEIKAAYEVVERYFLEKPDSESSSE